VVMPAAALLDDLRHRRDDSGMRSWSERDGGGPDSRRPEHERSASGDECPDGHSGGFYDAILQAFWGLEPPWRCFTRPRRAGVFLDRAPRCSLCGWRSRQQTGGDGFVASTQRPALTSSLPGLDGGHELWIGAGAAVPDATAEKTGHCKPMELPLRESETGAIGDGAAEGKSVARLWPARGRSRDSVGMLASQKRRRKPAPTPRGSGRKMG